MHMRLDARDEENAFLGATNEILTWVDVMRRGASFAGGAWGVTTGVFWVQACFGRKPHTSPTSRTNFLNHP